MTAPIVKPTPEEVADLVGVVVTQGEVDSAFLIVETMVGYDLSDARVALLYFRDRRLLRQAVVWQAAYINANPDVLTRLGGLTTATANGVSVTYAGSSSATEGLIGPLAKMSLDRLSWRRSRSIAVRPADPLRPRKYGRRPQTLVDDGDEGEWTAIH